MAYDLQAVWKLLLAAWVGLSVLVWWQGLTAFFTAATGLIPVFFSCRSGAAADDHVGQSKERIQLMPVLGQSPIPRFPMPE